MFEHTIVELKTDTNNILLVSGYRPSNSNTKEFLKDYRNAIKMWQKLKHHELIVGLDNNLDFLKSDKHPQTQTFLEFNLDLKPTITRPTRITQESATLIDNVFVSRKLQYNYSSSIVINDISDHMPSLVILRNQRKCKKEPIKIQTREINKKITELKDKIKHIDWEHELSKRLKK